MSEATGEAPSAGAKVRWLAFHSIIAGSPGAKETLAREAGITMKEVEAALEGFLARGLVRIDAVGRVVGIGGASLEPTRHRMRLDGVDLFTWCAIDAVGIPAALGRSAVVETTCPHCGATIAVRIEGGRADSEQDPVFWPPAARFESVVDELCPLINAFCDESHLEAWRAAEESPPGRPLTLGEVGRLGSEWWSWAR